MQMPILLNGELGIIGRILLLSFLLTGCQTFDEWIHGDEIEITKDVSFFSKIVVSSNLEVELYNDSINRVSVYYRSEQIDKIQMEVVDSVLYLSCRVNQKWLTDYSLPKIKVGCTPELSELRIETASHITTIDTLTINHLFIPVPSRYAEMDLVLKSDKIYFYTNGNSTGYFTFGGKIKVGEIYGYGASQINTLNLNAQILRIGNHSIGNFQVGNVEYLICELWNDGNIYYREPTYPITIEQQSGKGRAIPF